MSVVAVTISVPPSRLPCGADLCDLAVCVVGLAYFAAIYAGHCDILASEWEVQQRQLAARLAVLAATLAVLLATTDNARISGLPTFKSRMTLLLVCISMHFVSSSQFLQVGCLIIQFAGLHKVCPALWSFYLHPAPLMLQLALHNVYVLNQLEKFRTSAQKLLVCHMQLIDCSGNGVCGHTVTETPQPMRSQCMR